MATSAIPKDPRAQARALALQALCLFDALAEDFEPRLEGFLRDHVNHADLGWAGDISPQTLTLARSLAHGTWKFREQCDRQLSEHVTDWSVARMQPVDRNILRLGIYELLERPDVPHQVVITQAIELAKYFGGDDSPAFVNGVLDGIRRRLDEATPDLEVPGNEAPQDNRGSD